MIIRNFAVRHGRRALAAPVPLSSLRALSTESTSTRTAVAEPPTSSPSPSGWSKTPAKAELDRIPEDFHKFQDYQRQTQSLGSKVHLRYLPDEILKRPPTDATLEDLMAAQAHIGHNTSLWNPANARYIYGVRSGIHIISLETTAAHLRRAARVVEEVAYRAGLILFVGTRKGQTPIVVRAAELAGPTACHLFQKWTPGTITNRDQILAGGILQIVDENDHPLEGFESHLQERRPVVPDLVVCLNPMENYTMLHECGLANIPTIGIIDTDADPTWVTYQIPANDDSLRSAALIAMVLGKAGARGLQRRKDDAENGQVNWETPRDVQQYITVETQRMAAEIQRARKEAEGEDGKSLREDPLDNQTFRELFEPPHLR